MQSVAAELELGRYLVGGAFSVLAPAFQLYWIPGLLWRRVAADEGVPVVVADSLHRRDLPAVLGIVERVLFFGTILAGASEFVGIWLALKVAGGWEAWSKGREIPFPDGNHEPTKITLTGRHEFNTFLIGSGVSVLFAFVGTLIVKWWHSAPAAAWGVSVGAVAGSGILLAWAKFRAPKLPNPG
jgi:hypothetical protein